MAVNAVFPRAELGAGMYESFYLRAVAPDEPLGVWIRYTVHKQPGHAPQGSLWCTVFDASANGPLMCKHTTTDLSVPANGWIAVAGSQLGDGRADGHIEIDRGAPHAGEPGKASSGQTTPDEGGSGQVAPDEVRWSLRFASDEPELRHLKQDWLYRAPLPRTKLTSPMPAATFDGVVELPGRTLDIRGWKGMLGHNWGAEHAERWIWLHGIGFEENPSAWLDVAIGRVLIAGRATPWVANGVLFLDGRRLSLGGLFVRGLKVRESAARCTLSLPGENGLMVDAHVNTPLHSAAGWRYADPDGGEHDVVNCSVAELTLNVRPRAGAGQILRTAHGAAYELGMREHDHGVPLAPFGDG